MRNVSQDDSQVLFEQCRVKGFEMDTMDLPTSLATTVAPIFFFFTNLCNAPVIQENSYTIVNINPEAVNTLQNNKQNKTK